MFEDARVASLEAQIRTPAGLFDIVSGIRVQAK